MLSCLSSNLTACSVLSLSKSCRPFTPHSPFPHFSLSFLLMRTFLLPHQGCHFLPLSASLPPDKSFLFINAFPFFVVHTLIPLVPILILLSLYQHFPVFLLHSTALHYLPRFPLPPSLQTGTVISTLPVSPGICPHLGISSEIFEFINNFCLSSFLLSFLSSLCFLPHNLYRHPHILFCPLIFN